MQLKLEANGVNLKLTTKEEKVDFMTLTKAYEIVTGDELEINETGASRNTTPTREEDSSEQDRTPGWKQPVKVQLMCPYCGRCQDTTTLYGNHWLKCPACGKKVRLQSATSRWGVPDEHGYYYKATEVYRDRDAEKVDDDLLNEMKRKMEGKDDD